MGSGEQAGDDGRGAGSLEALAERLGCSSRTLQRYRARGWDGNPDSLEDWKRANLRRAGAKRLMPRTDHPEGAEQSEHAKRSELALLRYREAKAAEQELRAAQLAARLVDRAEVERLFVARVAEVRAALVHLPRQLARRLANQTAEVVEDELDAEIRKILERFARGDPVLEGARRKVARPRRA